MFEDPEVGVEELIDIIGEVFQKFGVNWVNGERNKVNKAGRNIFE